MSTSGAELLVPGTRTITFFTVPEKPPHHDDLTPRRRCTLAGSPSALARPRMCSRTLACAAEPMGWGTRATTLTSSIARSAEKASLGALAGTGSGGMAGSAATHPMATTPTASPSRTSQKVTAVRFIVVLLVVPIAPTVAHDGHTCLCALPQ